MSGAALNPRPSVSAVFIRSYRLLPVGFSAFFPTFLIYGLLYSLVFFLVYQNDPLSVTGEQGTGDNTEAYLGWRSPLFWTPLLFVPCAIWWHRFSWSGETGQPWSIVFSQEGGKYFLLSFAYILFLIALGSAPMSVTSAIDGFQNRAVGMLVILLFAIIFVATWVLVAILTIPFLVSWAVDHKFKVWMTFGLIRRHLEFCSTVFLLSLVPLIVWAIIVDVALFIAPWRPWEFLVEEAARVLGFVVVGAAWVNAQTIAFRWIIDQTLTESIE